MRTEDQNSTLGFPIFADDSTAIGTGKTSLTITSTLAKNGGTASSVSPTITELGNGIYWVTPIAAHRNTIGCNVWQFSASGAVIAPVFERIRVTPVAAGDAMALTPSERTTFAGVLESAMLNDSDGSALLAGIQAQLQAIFNEAGDVPVATLVNLIVSGVWSHATRTLTALSPVTVGGYSTGQDPATLLSGTVSKVTVIDGLLTALTEVVESVTRFKAAALSQAPSGGGGSGDAEQATLLEVQDTVESIAAELSGSRAITPTGRVAQGGTVKAYIGDDFRVRSGTQLPIPVADVGAVLKTKLEAIGIANLRFGAAPTNGDPGAITGTISGITASSGITTISIEISNCGANLMPGDMPYQIQQTQQHGSEFDDSIELEGTLRLKARTVAALG